MATTHNCTGWMLGSLIVAVLWFGLLVGVSFLATPVKFLAPSLTLAVALDVGRHTFAVFNRLEWLLSVLLLIPVLIGSRSWSCRIAAIGVATLVLIETVWLLPLLDVRVSAIIAGQQPPVADYHDFYIAIDLAKLAALALIAGLMTRRLALIEQKA